MFRGMIFIWQKQLRERFLLAFLDTDLMQSEIYL